MGNKKNCLTNEPKKEKTLHNSACEKIISCTVWSVKSIMIINNYKENAYEINRYAL